MRCAFVYKGPVGSTRTGKIVNFTRSVTSYSLERRVSDYASSTIKLDVTLLERLDWVINGHGRDVFAYSPGGRLFWRGYVEDVSVEQPGLSLSSSIANLNNKVAVTATDPIVEDEIITSYTVNQRSIDRYGTYPKIFDGKRDFLENAEMLRDSIVSRVGTPETEKTLSDLDDSAAVVTLTLATYEKRLDYPYLSSGGGTQTRKDKIISVLQGHPDSLFSANYIAIEEDNFSFDSDEDNRSGLEIIKDLCDRGGSSSTDYNRRVFWIDTDLVLHLSTIPQRASYARRLRTGYTKYPAGYIDIWDISPGKWLIYPDIFLGGGNFGLEDNKQAVFIEAITWTGDTEGDNVTPTGGSVSTVKQALKKWLDST